MDCNSRSATVQAYVTSINTGCLKWEASLSLPTYQIRIKWSPRSFMQAGVKRPLLDDEARSP
jgi:hypothetical protein